MNMIRKNVSPALSALILLTLVLCTVSSLNEIRSYSAPAEPPQWLIIRGLVQNPLNLSYSELETFPQLSEVAELRCITPGTELTVTYNWTGVPLFYLLSIVGMLPQASFVVFNAVDGYSNNVTLETAMHPTTILALKANGTDLNQLTGFGSGSRIVLPCRWGYKWVKWVNEIVVGDTTRSYSEGFRSNCSMPETQPSFQTMNMSKSIDSETTEYTVLALSTTLIESSTFVSNRRLIFNLSPSQQPNDFFYLTFSTGLLAYPCRVIASQGLASYVLTESDGNVFLFVNRTYSEEPMTVEVRGGYSQELLQSLVQYCSLRGMIYYDIELREHLVHLICQYI